MITPKKSRKKFLRFGIIKIEKDEFPHYKSPFFSENVDTDKVLVSKKYSFSEKKKKKQKKTYTLHWLLVMVVIKLRHSL